MINHTISITLKFNDQNSILLSGLIDNHSCTVPFQINPFCKIDYLAIELPILICFKSILIEELAFQLENYPSANADEKLNNSMQNGFAQFHNLIQKIETFNYNEISLTIKLLTGIQTFKCQNLLDESINYTDPILLKNCKALNAWLRN